MSTGPRSLSVVTVSPEIQNHLEALSFNGKVIPIGGNPFSGMADEIGADNYNDDFQDDKIEIEIENDDFQDKIVVGKFRKTKSPDMLRRRSSVMPTVSPVQEDDEDSPFTSDEEEEEIPVPMTVPKLLAKNDQEETDSIGECSIENLEIEVNDILPENSVMNHRLTRLLSVLYGMMIAMIGVMLAVKDITNKVNDSDHMFGIIVNIIGIAFLVFLHQDIQRHKNYIMNNVYKNGRRLQPNKTEDSIDVNQEDLSVTTAIIFNSTLLDNTDKNVLQAREMLSSYKIQKGKHSGNFYLKIGMTLFCMGSIVHQGASLALQIHFYNKGIAECQNAISVTVYAIRCIAAFYQLYMAYKYNNLIIHRYKVLAMFGFMHTLGSCLAFWFSTIIEEAMDGYTKKMRAVEYINATHIIPSEVIEYKHRCQNMTELESVDNWPYLYPFSIEYNIILAAVFYIMWTNIGNHNVENEFSHVKETDEKTSNNNYRSNVQMTADCHASILGLFSGLMALLVVLVSAIVFFSTVSKEDFHDFGVEVYTFQFAVLTLSLSVAIFFASIQLRRLNVSHHLDSATSSMDDFLLILPLPFFFLYHTMCINSNARSGQLNHMILAALHFVDLCQVVYQSLVLIDGMRKCSNNHKLRFFKPGKGMITFAIITNVAYWLLGTFEMKTVDKYHTMSKYYGKFEWMVILDSCLPLMLFYRFHSSVCLSDIWGNAYKEDEKLDKH